jgi:hypothetical protein
MSARWEGVRVRNKSDKRAGTVLLGPVRRYGKDWPGFNVDGHWVVPVRMDDNGIPELFQTSLLESYTDPEPEPDPAAEDRKKLAECLREAAQNLEMVTRRLQALASTLERGREL